ncbi:MAG: SH3 domain-containing protein, partial [Gammaproteobacteria bacterium]
GTKQAARKSTVATEKLARFLSIDSIATLLAGCVAGVAISAIFWWVISIGTVDDSRMIAHESFDAIQVGSINKSSENIMNLTKRIETLTDTVLGLEVKLRGALALADDMADKGNKAVEADSRLVPDTVEPDAPVAIADKYKTEAVFTPTHTVNANLNLRTSPSLSSAPIAVLKAGSKVSYINEKDGWYFVNTRSHGEGWCSSEYLSPLQVTQ